MLGDYFHYPKTEGFQIKVARDGETIYHFELYVNNI